MRQYRFAPLAEHDLESIWQYTAQHWSPAQADRYVSDLFDTVEGIATGALNGRPVDVRDGYLKCRSGAHMIYFRQDDEAVIIVRNLHQSMDVQRHL